MDNDKFKREFLVRYRLPRPVSRAYEVVTFSQYEDEAACKIAWCAGTAVRFFGVVRQANLLFSDGSLSVNPPSYNDLRMDMPDTVFPRDFTARITPVLLQLAGILRGGEASPSKDILLQALMTINFMSRYRLVVVEPDGYRVLMGPRIEYLVWSGERDRNRHLLSGTVVLVDAGTGEYISLNPLVVWYRKKHESLGHLFVLRKIDGWNGIYREDGVPGTPSMVVPFRDHGRPVRGILDVDPETLRNLSEPPVRFSDGQEKDAYYIEGLIWRGGLSDIYIAENRNTGKKVVLKTYKSDVGGFDENYWRFINERNFSSRISNDAVIRPRDTDFGLAYEQDYMRGGSLNDLLEDSGVLNGRKAKNIVLDLLEILASIHDQGIAHNDVKPDNILFTGKGGVRIIDFGIAHNFGNTREAYSRGAPAGTRSYMSPDVIDGEIPSIQSDLFSLGVVFAQMLTGKILRSFPEVSDNRAVPGELHAFFRRCLARNLEEVFQNAREAANILAPVRLNTQIAVTLDVEGTLVTNYYEKAPRPGLGEFLGYCMDRFDRICIYTLLTEEECREVFISLQEKGILPHGFFETYEYMHWSRGEDGSVKDLRRCYIPVEENIMVDDMAEMIPEEQHYRFVHIAGYHEPVPYDRGLFLAQKRIDDILAGSLIPQEEE